jgi:hypothetical protein
MKTEFADLFTQPVEDTVTLDQVLTDQPWLSSFKIGRGINAVTGAVCGTPFTDQGPSDTQPQEYERIQTTVSSKHELEDILDISFFGSYNINNIAQVSAEASWLREVKFSETSMTILLELKYLNKTYSTVNANSMTLINTASELLKKKDITKFREMYGDYFVSGARFGASLRVIYQCFATSASSLAKFKAEFSVEKTDLFSAGGKIAFQRLCNRENITVKSYVKADGISQQDEESLKKMIDNSHDVKAVEEWFEKNKTPFPKEAELTHYSTIYTEFSPVVEASPQDFGEIRSIYTTLWDTLFMITNTKWKNKESLMRDFSALKEEVFAHQNVIASDKGVRHTYDSKVKDFQAKILHIQSRYEDVFAKLPTWAGEEPVMNKTFKSGSGSKVWIYGAVPDGNKPHLKINSYPQYKYVGHGVGTKTYPFIYTQPNTIIVGWKVEASWDDSGYWAKETPTNIGQSKGRIGTKAIAAFKNMAWTVTYYWVSCDDYQF